MNTPADDRLLRLKQILVRAKRNAALTAEAKRKLKAANRDKSVAEDYADRLAERAKFRELLSQERMDGWRFRWYFTNIQTDHSLEELRAWIDSKVAAEEKAA